MNGLEEVAVNSDIPRYLLYYRFYKFVQFDFFELCVCNACHRGRPIG